MAVERIKNGVGNYPYSDCFFFCGPGGSLSSGPTHIYVRLCLYLIRLGDPDYYMVIEFVKVQYFNCIL